MQDCQIKARSTTIGKVCTILLLANHDLFQEEDPDVGDRKVPAGELYFAHLFCSILIIIMIQILKNTKNMENMLRSFHE